MEARPMDPESQNRTVRKHLILYRSITSAEAIRLYGITRLSARIQDLEAQGMCIDAPLEFDPVNKSRHWTKYKIRINTQ